MKKTIALLIIIQIALLFNSCSSDSGDTPAVVIPTTPVVINTTIKSYSKDYGTTGETITMTGENFSAKISEIKITFDGVAATILSATATEITFALPVTEKLLPKLVVTIENRTVTNAVKNNYGGNIGILPIPSITTWFTIDNGMKSVSGIPHIQMISDKIMYISMELDSSTSGVIRTLDGGITWKAWAGNYYNTGFYATQNGEGLCYTLFGYAVSGGGVNKIPVEGKTNQTANTYVWKEINSSRPGIYSLFIEDNMQKGTIVSQRGDVYTTINGTDFAKIYSAKLYEDSFNQNYDDGAIYRSAVIDNDHIWAIGFKKKNSISNPFILYKNNSTDGWKEYSFVNELGYVAREVCFVNPSTGFLLINALDVKLYKTADGGDTWSLVYNGEKFTKFTFKDANTGWAILDNKIYKTTNGGVAWTLDYTHDQPIRNIAYKNNVVWAISNDKIIKRYL
jgi:hypothetical protein